MLIQVQWKEVGAKDSVHVGSNEDVAIFAQTQPKSTLVPLADVPCWKPILSPKLSPSKLPRLQNITTNSDAQYNWNLVILFLCHLTGYDVCEKFRDDTAKVIFGNQDFWLCCRRWAESDIDDLKTEYGKHNLSLKKTMYNL